MHADHAPPDPLDRALGALAEALAPVAGSDPAIVRESLAPPPKHGHADIALAAHRFAKQAGTTPPELAARLAAAARELDFVAEAEAAGPFCNITWAAGRLAADVIEAVRVSRTQGGLVAGSEGEGATVVLDFSSPNAARKLAFHHLRGTVVGASLARLWEARGWSVVRLNFLGDWGHNIGQLLHKLSEIPAGDADHIDPSRLQQLYVEVNEEEAADPDRIKAASGEWLRRFEEQDPVAVRRWQLIVDSTTEALDATYARLGIRFDEYRGESNYVKTAVGVAEELVEAAVARVDPESGAVYVPETDGLQAVVLVNSRGISTYEGRDCAAAVDRHLSFRFDRSVYLTDVGQGGRFAAVFAALDRAGFEWAQALVHLGFGQMRLGGRKAKTRQGTAVPLDDVLDEAVARAETEIATREMDLDDPAETARIVGIGAVVFSQVRMRRTSDFDFDLDSAVAFRGETGPRIQYTHARIMSILRRADVGVEAALSACDASRLTDPLERDVVLAVAAVPGATRKAVETDDPSHLADAAVGLADAWGAYQTAGARERPDLRVLATDADLRRSRLGLAAATACGIRDIFGVLGVECPDRM
ncbi:MAG: arginine--tRNA ligase [Acidimicrobiia bacterium]|nr:arginine--tRNA ligase [Acidimicrobiia bacterium]